MVRRIGLFLAALFVGLGILMGPSMAPTGTTASDSVTAQAATGSKSPGRANFFHNWGKNSKKSKGPIIASNCSPNNFTTKGCWLKRVEKGKYLPEDTRYIRPLKGQHARAYVLRSVIVTYKWKKISRVYKSTWYVGNGKYTGKRGQ